MPQNVDAGDVLRTFYTLRQEHTGQRPPTFRRPDALAAAQRLLDVFAELGADDPLAYLRWRWSAAAHAGHPVGITACACRTQVLRWSEVGQGHALAQAQAEKLARRAGSAWEQSVKELRPLTRGMEDAKRPYQGRPDLCMADIELTGGYHPKSPSCLACSAAVQCTARLYQIHGWDVASLRAGRLHVLPREVAAAAVR